MTPEQTQQLNEVYEFVQQLKRSQTIPKDTADAFRARIGGFDAVLGGAPTAYLQAVNEAGSASYDVLGEPNRMVQIKVDGVYRLFPDYS